VGELQEKIKVLGQLNIVISKLPIQRLQDLQEELVQEIKNRGDAVNRDLERIRDERAQVQAQYDMALQQKKEIEGRIEEVMKNNEGDEERAMKSLQEKDEVEAMVQKTQEVVQKLYKEVPEVPLVIEATMEEQLLKIGEVIKGFREKIQDLQLRSMPEMPPEVHEGRVRMEMTTVSNIKKVEDECTKLCEESVQVWTELMGDPGK
jgi:DNA repair exonuclease SbcCD ATPase subunit